MGGVSAQHPGSDDRAGVSEDSTDSTDSTPEGAPAGSDPATEAVVSRGWTAIRPKPWKLLVLLFGVAAFALAVDIVTKVTVVAQLQGRPPLRVLGGLVYLVLYRNPGAAFSLATGMTWLLALLAIAVVAVIIWLAPKLRSTG